MLVLVRVRVEPAWAAMPPQSPGMGLRLEWSVLPPAVSSWMLVKVTGLPGAPLTIRLPATLMVLIVERFLIVCPGPMVRVAAAGMVRLRPIGMVLLLIWWLPLSRVPVRLSTSVPLTAPGPIVLLLIAPKWAWMSPARTPLLAKALLSRLLSMQLLLPQNCWICTPSLVLLLKLEFVSRKLSASAPESPSRALWSMLVWSMVRLQPSHSTSPGAMKGR